MGFTADLNSINPKTRQSEQNLRDEHQTRKTRTQLRYTTTTQTSIHTHTGAVRGLALGEEMSRLYSFMWLLNVASNTANKAGRLDAGRHEEKRNNTKVKQHKTKQG